jgi:hypothetical protein
VALRRPEAEEVEVEFEMLVVYEVWYSRGTRRKMPKHELNV